MTDTIYEHFTVRARVGRFPFLDEALARWVWRRLTTTFPDALAAIVMPDHLRLVTPSEGEAGRRRLAAVMGASRRALGSVEGRGAVWQPIEEPTKLASPDKVRRSVRYLWLNPCRPWRLQGRTVRLVDDPLRWPWSTLHDSIGAIVDPWVPGDRVARAFGWSTGAGVAERLHRYATKDEHVAPAARAFPQRPAPSPAPDRALDDVFEAALVTTRRDRSALTKRTPAREIAVGLAYRQGWRQAKGLASTFGLHPTTVSKIARRVDEARIETAAFCLDARLLGRSMADLVNAA